MPTHYLTVLQPIGDTGRLLGTVLKVHHTETLQWLRQHADEIAGRFTRCDSPIKAAHVALSVSETNPEEAPNA